MEPFVRPDKTRSRWLKAVPLGLALLLLGCDAGAQTASLFEVGVDADGADPLVNYLTQIYATNFVCGADGQSSQFSFTQYTGSQNWLGALYHNWYNTLNFTNVGEMDSVTGFYFDTQPYPSSADREAASFYNSGSINCGASFFTNAILLNYYSQGGISYGGYGGIDVWATNIFSGNNSTITVGFDGLARFGGHNLVFSNTTVTIQTSSGIVSGGASANVYATGQAAYNTNSWAIADLQPTYAYAWLNSLPDEIYLLPAVPYYQEQDNVSTNGTNVTVRMIFLQDSSVNVAANVYIGGNQPFVNGEGTVEWVGTYTNPATGQASTRYLYLNDNYVGSADTNILKYGDPGIGVPNNFVIYPSATRLGLGSPVASGYYPNLDTADSITNNIYSYVDAQMIPSSVSPLGNGSGAIALTNMPGRVEITASNELNLSRAVFSGMNYLRLNSTNQFDYDGRDQVSAPYADFYLGSTNGSMAITNLIEPILPVWSGSLQAFSTRWGYTNAGINYDFRVMLVQSQLSPVSSSSVQDFVLYSSNNVVISDVLNITRTFSLNCTNLLLTTNAAGTGAASPDGELNLGLGVTNWQSATPRLRCLNNNGVISMSSSSPAKFGSLSKPYLALVNTGLIDNPGSISVFSADLENYGTIAAGAGSFTAQTLTTTMSGSTLLANTTVSLAASNLVITGTSIQSGNSLTLIATNLLTDNGVNSGNFWSLGANDTSYGNPLGLDLPIKPAYGDLLGTTITNLAQVANAVVNNIWAGQDRGCSTAGYQDNAAIGQLVLDAQTNTAVFNFTGASTDGSTNAIYVDCLVLNDFASTSDGNGNLPALTFANNLVIYYAQAVDAGGSVAEYINGFNNDHLRWVSNYVGHFSSTNITYPDGKTYTVNAALASSPLIDSDRDGINNSDDATPFLVPPELDFTVSVTNYPPLSARIGWQTIPLAGNYVYYSTNLASTNWLPFTNFSRYYWASNNVVFSNPASGGSFISPQPYDDGLGIHLDNGEMANVWVLDSLTNAVRFYRIMVQPN
jgi:hypothetical protein